MKFKKAKDYIKYLDEQSSEAWSNDNELLSDAMEDYAKMYHEQQVKNCSIPLVSVSNLPTEDEIIKTILNCVDIRGIELEYYRGEFTDDRSGLITALNKLYSR